MGAWRGIRGAISLAGVCLLLSLGIVGQAFACEFTLKAGGESSGPGRLDSPRDVAIDASGNAWVADTGHNRVQKFNSAGEFVSQFGVPKAASSGTPAQVYGLDLDPEGDIWLAVNETGANQVRQYKPNGELISSWSQYALGIAIDAGGNVWVTEGDVVKKFNSKGELLLQFGKFGTGNGEFSGPEAIAIDSEGNILVADTGNNRYQEFNSAGEFVRKVGSAGTGNGQFKSPRGIAVDSEGRVWVSDSGNNRLQRFSSKGAYQTQFGAYGPNDGQFSSPRGIAISGSTLWVADTGNDRVQKFGCP